MILVRVLINFRCGSGIESGGVYPNIMAMRDDLLSALTAQPGFYRSSKTGYVDGDAQCVGDQSSKECKDCVKKAVEELQKECPSSVSGVVYLGKCYAEYAAQVVHQYPYGSNSSPSSQEHDHGRFIKSLFMIYHHATNPKITCTHFESRS